MISKCSKVRTCAVAAALVCVSGVALAQANTVTYQGVLRDVAGDPVVDGPYATSFGIFAAESGGSPLWTESQTATTSNGAFSVQLGAVTPLGTLFADNAGGALWLEVSADVGSGMQAYLPRVPVTRAPYAFHATRADSADTAASAGDADTVDGKHAADIDADITGAVGAHDVSVTAHSDIRTQIGADIGAHNVSGTAHSDIRAQIGTDITAHDGDSGAHATIELDAARITSGTLSNARLNMGHGGGIDADKLDGLELSSIQGFVTSHNSNAAAHANIELDAARITSGTIDIGRLPTGTTGSDVALGDHVHDGAHIATGTVSTDRFSAYNDLTAESKIGAGAAQVAAGNHVHD
ncbi:MAG TPA: hypothetical protein PKL84_16440, partial [Candidatus Hydrogenedentes bacterium]|nr:hypothetical protein [Candidatus Hydrogenedentota bacterium]